MFKRQQRSKFFWRIPELPAHRIVWSDKNDVGWRERDRKGGRTNNRVKIIRSKKRDYSAQIYKRAEARQRQRKLGQIGTSCLTGSQMWEGESQHTPSLLLVCMRRLWASVNRMTISCVTSGKLWPSSTHHLTGQPSTSSPGCLLCSCFHSRLALIPLPFLNLHPLRVHPPIQSILLSIHLFSINYLPYPVSHISYFQLHANRRQTLVI